MLITIGVGLAAPVVGDVDASNDQREAWLEPVEIEPVSYPERESRRRRGGLGRGFHGVLVIHLDGSDGAQRPGDRRRPREGSRKDRDGTANGGGGGEREGSFLSGTREDW